MLKVIPKSTCCTRLIRDVELTHRTLSIVKRDFPYKMKITAFNPEGLKPLNNFLTPFALGMMMGSNRSDYIDNISQYEYLLKDKTEFKPNFIQLKNGFCFCCGNVKNCRQVLFKDFNVKHE